MVLVCYNIIGRYAVALLVVSIPTYDMYHTIPVSCTNGSLYRDKKGTVSYYTKISYVGLLALSFLQEHAHLRWYLRKMNVITSEQTYFLGNPTKVFIVFIIPG